MSETLLKSFRNVATFQFLSCKNSWVWFPASHKNKDRKSSYRNGQTYTEYSRCFVDLPVTCPCFCFLGNALHVHVHTEAEGGLSRCFSPWLFHSASADDFRAAGEVDAEVWRASSGSCCVPEEDQALGNVLLLSEGACRWLLVGPTLLLLCVTDQFGLKGTYSVAIMMI